MSSEAKVKIILHGYLKDLYPEDLMMSGHNVAEIINGMCLQTKAFNPKPGDDRHCVAVVGFDSRESLYEPLSPKITELHITPAFCGGKGGFFKVVIGVVLIAAALYFGPALGSFTAFGATTQVASMLFNFGVSLVLGGLLEMLSPAPKADTSGLTNTSAGDPEASKYLGANQNTVKIGTRIPIVYGEYLLYGHYISFDVDARDVSL